MADDPIDPNQIAWDKPAAAPAADPSGVTWDADKYGSLGQQALTVGEGVAKGLISAPATAAIERGLTAVGVPGLSPAEQEGRAAQHPIESGGGEALGLLGPALVSGGASLAAKAGVSGAEALGAAAKLAGKYTQAGLLEKAGAAGASALGLGGEGAGLISRIGSKAVQGAIENGLYSTGDIGAKIVNGHDPAEAVQTAIPALGLSVAIGGSLGGAIGAVPELWKATAGGDTGTILQAITKRLGGRESSVVSDPVTRALETLGVEPKPETVAAMAESPHIQAMAKAVEESPGPKGKDYAASLKDFHDQARASIADTVGKTPEELAGLGKISKYETGRNIGETLADEYQGRQDPLSKEYAALEEKTAGAPLNHDAVMKTPPDAYGQAPPDVTIPGTASLANAKLDELAVQEGWRGGDADIERELTRVQKALPEKATVGDLTQLATQVGNNTKSTLPFGQQTPLSRAGQLIKKVLIDARDSVMKARLGDEGPELADRFDKAREAYKAQAALRDALNDRLKINGSVSGFGKGLREMARTDGEGVLNRLSGKGDANLLEFLNQNFPKTAQAVREYHLSNLFQDAVSRAKPGESFNIPALQRSVEKLSEQPELAKFVVPPSLSSKLDAMGILQDQLNRVPHNFSNTARATGVMNKYGMATAMGMVSMLTGHGVAASVLAAELAHTLSKTAPDAARLALLKFLGSSQPIDGVAFKAMSSFIRSAQRGENLLLNGTKALFESGSKVIPDHLIPNKDSRAKLQKSLDAMDNIDKAMDVGRGIHHYLPSHATATAATAATAKTYLRSLQPKQPQGGPLDKPLPVDPVAQQKYDRQLDIAEQPLMVLVHAKKGTLQAQDVQTLQTIYPQFHARVIQAAYDQLAKAKADGTHIPYGQRASLSLLMGSPLDSTLSQPGMAAIAMANASGGPPAQGPGKPRRVSQSTARTQEKVNQMYETPNQAGAARRVNS